MFYWQKTGKDKLYTIKLKKIVEILKEISISFVLTF